MPERSVKHNMTHFGWVGAGYISGLNPVWSCCGCTLNLGAGSSALCPIASYTSPDHPLFEPGRQPHYGSRGTREDPVLSWSAGF